MQFLATAQRVLQEKTYFAGIQSLLTIGDPKKSFAALPARDVLVTDVQGKARGTEDVGGERQV